MGNPTHFAAYFLFFFSFNWLVVVLDIMYRPHSSVFIQPQAGRCVQYVSEPAAVRVSVPVCTCYSYIQQTATWSVHRVICRSLCVSFPASPSPIYVSSTFPLLPVNARHRSSIFLGLDYYYHFSFRSSVVGWTFLASTYRLRLRQRCNLNLFSLISDRARVALVC